MTLPDIVHLVQSTLKANGATPDLITKTIRDLEKAAEEQKENRATGGKRAKYQLVPIVFDKNGLITETVTAIVAQIEDGVASREALVRIKSAIATANASPKRRGKPYQTVGEAVEHIKRGFLKGAKVAIKSGKQTVEVITSDNSIT